MTKEEILFRKHLEELAQKAYQRGIPCFTDFLDLNEQNIFHSMKSRLSFVRCRLYGGYDEAERQMLGFLPDAFCFGEDGAAAEKALFPITAMSIKPQDLRFTQPLTHRDYLGSLMNLGIKRSAMGDILVDTEGAVLICTQTIFPYLSSELLRVKHSTVHCEETDLLQLKCKPTTEEVTASVSSVRLDALLSAAFNGSRSTLADLITSGLTYVNGRQILKASYEPDEGAIISLRGYGRFRYAGIVHETRKGRQMVKLEKFIH